MPSRLDEFAAAALTGILTRSPGATPEGAAVASYKYAEAMEAERLRRQKLQIEAELKAKGWQALEQK